MKRPTEARVAVLFSITVLLVLGLPGLYSNSLWLDEGFTRAAIDSLGLSLSQTPGQMPAYYILMNLWGKVSIVPWWLRLPSLIASIWAILLVSDIGRILANRSMTVLAPISLLASPMYVSKAIEARSYAFVLLFTALTVKYSLTLVGKRSNSGERQQKIAGYILIAIGFLGPAFHGLFFLYFACAIIAALLLAENRRTALKSAVRALLAGLVSSTLLIVFAAEDRSGVFIPGDIINRAADRFLSPLPPVAAIMGCLLVAGIFVSFSSIRLNRRQLLAYPASALISTVLSVWLIGNLFGVMEMRYFAPCAIYVALLISLGLSFIVGKSFSFLKVNNTGPSLSIGVCVLGVALLAVPGYLAKPPQQERVEDWKGVSDFLVANAADGDAIAFEWFRDGPLQFRAPFEASWSLVSPDIDLAVVSHERQLGRVRRYDEELPRPEFDRRLIEYDDIWMINFWNSRSLNDLRGRDFRESFDCGPPLWFRGEITVEHCTRE